MSQIGSNARAWLNTIRLAEGTWKNGSPDGYRTMFGGGLFDLSKGHPDRVVNGGRYSSAAAGGYQFMPFTWNMITKRLGMDPKDFSPAAQDRAAIGLIQMRGVDPNTPISRQAVNKLAPEWASFPTLAGKSYYGQPVKRYEDLERFYNSQLANPGNAVASAAVPPPAVASTGSSGNRMAGAGTGGGARAGGSLLAGLTSAGGGSGWNPMAQVTMQPVMDALTMGTSGAAQQQMLLEQQQRMLSQEAITSGRRSQLAANRQEPAGRWQRMAGSPGKAFLQTMMALSQPLRALA